MHISPDMTYRGISFPRLVAHVILQIVRCNHVDCMYVRMYVCVSLDSFCIVFLNQNTKTLLLEVNCFHF